MTFFYKILLSLSQDIMLLICLMEDQSVSLWVRLFQAQLISQVGEEWLVVQYIILYNSVTKTNQKPKVSMM